MTQVHEAVKILLDSPQYKKWKESNEKSYLSHCFKMFDEANQHEWQIGFCNADETITTFIVTGDEITESPPSEAFKKPDSRILSLEMDKVVKGSDEVLSVAKEFVEKEYSKEVITKEIMILQHLEVGLVYNITFVTMAMNTVNVKVSVDDAKIIEHRITSLMDFSLDK